MSNGQPKHGNAGRTPRDSVTNPKGFSEPDVNGVGDDGR